MAVPEAAHPLTDPAMWEGYVKGPYLTSVHVFTTEWLESFSRAYEFVGLITPEESLAHFKEIFGHLREDAVLCLILGSEVPYEHNTSINYQGREELHKKLNALIRAWVAEEPRVICLDFTKFIRRQSDYTDSINHFQRRVYYEAVREAREYMQKYASIHSDMPIGCLARLRTTIATWKKGNSWMRALYRVLKTFYSLMGFK